MKKYTISILAALALGALSIGAMADPIGPICHTDPNNDTCQGSLYAITYSGNALSDADPLHETFRIFLDIYTGFYNGGGSYLDDVSIKVSSSVFSWSLFSAPGGVGAWTQHDGGINASGCDGAGGGFVCADFTGPPPGLPVPFLPSAYEWAFDITVANGTLFTGALQSSIKARYVNSDDVKVGDLVSENITLQTGGCPPTVCTPQIFVPEPATLALLGIGLLGLGFVGTARRRI